MGKGSKGVLPQQPTPGVSNAPQQPTLGVPSALHQVEAPGPFDFHNPEQWPRWLRRFERFRVTAGLDRESEMKQVNTLIYIMGQEADDVFPTLVDADQDTDYKTTIEKFNAYFSPRQNYIYERAKFNSRVQEEGESVEDFITALYVLADTCGYELKYPGLKEELIRDRLIVGIRDPSLRQRLQLEDIDLKKAITMVRNREQVKKQQLQTPAPVPVVAALRGPNNPQQRPRQSGFPGSPEGIRSTDKVQQQQRQQEGCGFCGGGQRHGKGQCPAGTVKCFKCQAVGHYARMCRMKTVRQVENDDEQEKCEGFIGSMTSTEPKEISRIRSVFIQQFGTDSC